MNSDDFYSLIELRARRVTRFKALIGVEAFEGLKASRRTFGGCAMASVYFGKLQKLQSDFNDAFLAQANSGDPYAWEFLVDYDGAELEWLLAAESFSSGNRVAQARVRLLQKVLATRAYEFPLPPLHGLN